MRLTSHLIEGIERVSECGWTRKVAPQREGTLREHVRSAILIFLTSCLPVSQPAAGAGFGSGSTMSTHGTPLQGPAPAPLRRF